MNNHLFVYLFVLRERTFGCDLGEHLAKTNSQGKGSYPNRCMLNCFRCINTEMVSLPRKYIRHQASVWRIAFQSQILYIHSVVVLVPLVLRKCAEVIEKNGIVDGIYRLSGMSSNIQKLR